MLARTCGRPVSAQLRLDHPGRRLVPGDGEDRDPGQERDRHLEQEDRLPGDELGQDPADRRAQRGPGRAGDRPDRDRAPFGPDRRRQQLEHRGDRERAAERLHAAGRDQRAELRRGAAGEAGAGEDREPDRGGPSGADPAGEMRGGHGGERHHEVERDQDPGDAGDAGADFAVDLRQGQNDHRGVGQDEADRDGERRHARAPRSLNATHSLRAQYPSSWAYSRR